MAELDAEGGATTLDTMLAAVPPAMQGRAAKAKASFRAAVDDLAVFFVSEYIPHAREVPGCIGLANGQEVYALCLR